MDRTIVAVFAMLAALALLAGTSPALTSTQVPALSIAQAEAGYAAAPDLQQVQPLNVDIWISQTGSTAPSRRLDSGTTAAQIVIQSNLSGGEGQPNRFRAEVVDANGIRVFQSGIVELPTGTYSRTLEISGTVLFGGYINYVDSEKSALQNRIAQAISDANKNPPSSGAVRGPVQEAIAVVDRLSNGIERLRAFDLSADGGADAAFAAAQTALSNVRDRGNEALDLLSADPIDWDAVRAKLQDMQTAANYSATQIDTGRAAVSLDAERSFPPTGVPGRCNQNAVQLRVAGSDQISDDFWWTVGTPGTPARLTNSEEPASTERLLARPARIYSTQVNVSGVRHNTNIEALVLDALCLPVPGATVNFSTSASNIVTLDSPQATTDANGIAQVTASATSDVGNGSALVNATVDSVAASTSLTIIGPPQRLDLLLGGLELQRIPNYGVESTVQVSAQVKDVNGNDVADGTPVRFSINPPEHAFTDSGRVMTDRGQASAILVFGSATGLYTVGAESGDASDTQLIRVVGNPSQIELEAEPRIISVDTPIVDLRKSVLTVTVKDSAGHPAPDSTVVEFKFVDQDDADWAYFQGLTQVSRGVWETVISDGQVSAPLYGNQTWYREIEIRVTATYSVSNEVRGSVSKDITLILRGQSVFLPLIRK